MTKHRFGLRKGVALGVALALAAGGAMAGEKEELIKLRSTTTNLIQALVEQGILTKAKADELIRKAEQAADAEAAQAKASAMPADKHVVRVPYVPEFVKDQIREQVRAELRQDVVKDVLAQAKHERWGVPGSTPEWVDRITWEGDIRLRAQDDMFASGNAAYYNVQKINEAGGIGAAGNDAYLNTTVNRARYRARVRLGMRARITDGVEAGVRLATGNLKEPVSTNQTLGNSGNAFQVVLDRAYLRYDTTKSKFMTLWGGRMPNPFFHTDLVWDSDLNFDGIAATVRPLDWSEGGSNAAIQPFVTMGAFPLQEVQLSSHDKWLLGAQGGFNWTFDNADRLKMGVAYYDFRNTTGRRNTFGSTLLDYMAPGFVQKGNTVFDIRNDADPNTNLYALASDFHELNLTASYEVATWAPNYVVLTADYVKNLGFDRQAVFQRTGTLVDARTQGYQLKLTVGRQKLKKAGQWQIFGAYKYLQRDAVMDAYTDSDFHLGGTDAKGWLLGGSYALRKNTWVTARYLTADAIDGPKLGIDTLQLDLNAKF